MTIRNLRYVAVLEAISFLVLLFFSVVSRNESVIGVLGPLHGLLFIGYVGMVAIIREQAGFTIQQTIWLVVGAIVPFGGFAADWWLAKRYVAPAVADS